MDARFVVCLADLNFMIFGLFKCKLKKLLKSLQKNLPIQKKELLLRPQKQKNKRDGWYNNIHHGKA